MTDTKESILKAALGLFAVKGYEAVSVSQIAGALGITKIKEISLILFLHMSVNWMQNAPEKAASLKRSFPKCQIPFQMYLPKA